jgi:hypothetical protein
MRLEPMRHLQSVLKRAKKVIGIGKSTSFLLTYETTVSQTAEAHERV